MFKLPIKKCYFLAKICVLFMLVVTILSLFEHWRGGKRVARAQYADPLEEEYERQILMDEARMVPGLGDEGAPAFLSGEDRRLGEESEKKYAMNTYLSDRISYNRTLKDFRNPACPRIVYDAELPSASVVIIFHNEPYSVVLRTVWSVLNSARRDQPWYKKANFVDRNSDRSMKIGYPGQDPDSEYVYLKEIILVDDNSTLPELRGKLSHYVRTRLPPGLVRLLRLPDRQGLMRARSRGARAARGDVLVFLDAHCEAGADWLRPLLQRIQHKRNAVVTPVIDVVDQTTFHLDGAEFFQVGGFTFVGHFTWIDVPEREKKRRGSEIAPTWSPTMAGGLFAMSRSYYWELGAYDEQMAGWGGENLEMSFRIWQCGGTLETIPCSRVGHVFRAFHPYGLPADSDTHGINTARMAEVWMDEYAELFYLHRPDLRKNPIIGDVTHRKILREKLHCKSFQWFLDNVYKEKFVPVRDVLAYGRIKNPQTGLCLDTMQREGDGSALGFYPCHNTLSATQYLSLSLTGQLRDEEKCAELQFVRRLTEESEEDKPLRVLMVTCTTTGQQRGQQWNYLRASQQLRHVESGLCVDALGAAAGDDVRARACSGDPTQRWKFDYDDSKDSSKLLPPDMEENLQKLKGLRRRSRSLLAEAGGGGGGGGEGARRRPHAAHARRRRRRPRAKRKGRKKGKKNKFILIVERTLMNNSEEHLELDVHCAHRRLLPNNTFVRDLVTILNEKNIRRNRVTDLGKEDPLTLRQEETKVLEKMSLAPETLQPPNTAARPSEPMMTPEQPKRVKFHKKVRRRSTAPPAAPPPAPPPAASTPGAKRIIIEDFVEIKPSQIPPIQHPKKRKHQKKSTMVPHMLDGVGGVGGMSMGGLMGLVGGSNEDATPSKRQGDGLDEAFGNALDDSGSDDNYWSSGLVVTTRPSVAVARARGGSDSDDVYWSAKLGLPTTRPSAAGSGARGSDTDDAYWASKLGQTKNISALSAALRMGQTDNEAERSFEIEREERAQYPRARDPLPALRGISWKDKGKEKDKVKVQKRFPDVEIVDNKQGEEPGPVKLVMRSNLTFNLGDELFAWRKQPELVNMLEEQLSEGAGAEGGRARAGGGGSEESSASDSSGSAQAPDARARRQLP